MIIGNDRAIFSRMKRYLLRRAREEAKSFGTDIKTAANEWSKNSGVEFVTSDDWCKSVRGNYPKVIKKSVEQLIYDHGMLSGQNVPCSREYAPNMAAAMIQVGLPEHQRLGILSALVDISAQKSRHTKYETDIQDSLTGPSKWLALSSADILARALWMFKFREQMNRITNWINNDLAYLNLQEANECLMQEIPWEV